MRFPEFEGEWVNKKLGQIYKFKITNSLSRADLNYENGSVKNIHYGDIHTQYATLFDITKESVPYINHELNITKYSDENYCQEGDLIFADASEDYNDIGKCIEIVNLNNEKVQSGLHTLLARPEKSIMAIGFAGYLMKSGNVKLQIQREAQGTKVLSITSGRLSKIELIFPALPEQQKIASFFTAIDQKISQLKRKKTLLEQYKKGVIQKIFSQEIRFRGDNGQEFPRWEKKLLRKIAKIYDGTHQTPNYVITGIPFYSVEQVTANDFQNTKYISEDVFKKENQRVKLGKGDILMTRIGDIGTAKYIDWDVNASFYVSLALIKHSDLFNSNYLSHYISTQNFQKELWKRTIHVAFPKKINLGEIGECEVELPPLPEQTKIANFLSVIDDKINHTQTQIEKAEVWKKGLMQRMFV